MAYLIERFQSNLMGRVIQLLVYSVVKKRVTVLLSTSLAWPA